MNDREKWRERVKDTLYLIMQAARRDDDDGVLFTNESIFLFTVERKVVFM